MSAASLEVLGLSVHALRARRRVSVSELADAAGCSGYGPEVTGSIAALEDDLRLAHRVADEARRISLGWFGGPIESRSKADGSIVTDADEAVEDALRAMLATDRPGDPVLGEERGLTGLSERRWIIDGIDGTDSFAAGRSEWGTLIALQVDGDVVVGVADAPVLGRRFWATRGGGTYAATDEERTPRRLGVNRGVDIHRCRVIVPTLSWCRDDRDVAAANRVAMATRPAVPTEHPAIQVAMGGCEAAIFFRTGPWDIAAPALVVEEAGGKYTDLDGHRRLDSGCAVYSNGLIHDELLRLLSS